MPPETHDVLCVCGKIRSGKYVKCEMDESQPVRIGVSVLASSSSCGKLVTTRDNDDSTGTPTIGSMCRFPTRYVRRLRSAKGGKVGRADDLRSHIMHLTGFSCVCVFVCELLNVCHCVCGGWG